MTLLEIVATETRVFIHRISEVEIPPFHVLFPGPGITDLLEHRDDLVLCEDPFVHRNDVPVQTKLRG